MFENIQFDIRTSKTRLSSQQVNTNTLDEKKYSRENLLHSRFSIAGTAYGYPIPPISKFAMNNLFYMESFTIFDYDFASFTERENYDTYLLLYTYEGEGELDYKNRKYTLKEGLGALICCKDYQKYNTTAEHWKTAAIHVNGPLMDAFFEMYEQNGSVVFHDPVNGRLQSELEALLQLYEKPVPHREWHISAGIDRILSYLLSIASRPSSGKDTLPNNLIYLIRYMENNFTRHLTLDDLASFASVNKYYLSREFKKYTGFSPNDYLITLRINRAKLLLQTTDLTASEIAAKTGFMDQNNFTRLFKNKTGMTPIEFRKQFTTI